MPNFGGEWTVADIAYHAMQEIIIDLPTFELLNVPFDTKGCGYCVYWNYLREDIYNRQDFKKKVIQWYKNNKDKLVWIESNKVLTCDCNFAHPNGGYYEIK